MTVTSYSTALDYLGRKTDRPAPVHSSTRIVRDLVEPPSVSVVYHQTPVVTYRADGTILLYAAGWATKTTAAVMETYVPGLSVSVRRYADRVDSKVAERAVKRGERTIGADRRNHGHALQFDCIAASALLDADDIATVYTVTDNGRQLPFGITTESVGGTSLLGRHPGRTMPTYPCRCRMCQTGASTWQEAHFSAR